MQNSDGLDSEVQKLKTVFKYDDASNLDEMRKAEQAWEKIKAENPEIAAKTQREADEGFDKLMGQIHAMGIKPVTEEEYEREQKKNKREGVRFSRKGKRMLLIAAVVCVMGVGTTIVATANREYKYNVYPMQGEQNVLVKQNSALKIEASKLEDAYEQIEDILGIKALMLGHIPDGMKFKQLIIDEERAIIELDYDGTSVYFKEEKTSSTYEVSGELISDRKNNQPIHNVWINKDIVIESNTIEQGLIEYSININMDDANYYLSGAIKEEEFVKIAEGICYR